MNPIKPEEERFTDVTIKLSEAIHYNVTNLNNMGHKTVDPNLILLVSSGIQFYDKHTLIQSFIKNSHEECWDKIKERNEQYFIENASNIFKDIPSGDINLFKDLFNTKDQNGVDVVDQDIKDQIWRLFDAMVKICIKYVHKNRAPFAQKDEDNINHYYERSFFDEVDVIRHSTEWKLTLEFHPRI